MALIGKGKKNKNSSRSRRSSAKRIELKSSVKRSAIKKNLRRGANLNEPGRRLGAGILQNLRAPVLVVLAIGLGLLAFLVVGVGLLYSYSYFTTSDYFAIKTIVIEGHNRLKSREVIETAGLSYGQNTLAISIDEVERSLAANPWVEKLSVRRVLPDGIKIEVQEYEPHYWVKQGGQIVYADEYGAPIAPVAATEKFSSYPLLEIESGAEYLAGRLPELIKSIENVGFPLNLPAATTLKVSAARSLELNLDSGLHLVIGLDGWDANLKKMVRVLEDLTRRSEINSAAEVKALGKGVWVAMKRRQA